MYILYHAKQQMVSQILYLFFKYNSLKIFIVMNEGKQYIPELCKLRLIKMTVTLNYCLLLLILSTHNIYLLAFLKNTSTNSFCCSAITWKSLTDGIKLASMVWMFDKQNIKLRNTESRIKQHLLQKKLSKTAYPKYLREQIIHVNKKLCKYQAWQKNKNNYEIVMRSL